MLGRGRDRRGGLRERGRGPVESGAARRRLAMDGQLPARRGRRRSVRRCHHGRCRRSASDRPDRHHRRPSRDLLSDGPVRHHGWLRGDHRGLLRTGGEGSRDAAQRGSAARRAHATVRSHREPDARRGVTSPGDHRRDRGARAPVPVPAVLLPTARRRRVVRHDDLGDPRPRADLDRGRAVRLRAVARGGRRAGDLPRRHGRLLHRVLRTAEGRGPLRQVSPRRRPAGLRAGVQDHRRGRHRGRSSPRSCCISRP